MAERKCTYDPLVELMAYYADRKEVREQVDLSTLPVEERLKRRIIDGDQIGLDADLTEALRAWPALEIINTFLLDGMKVVGELFGSGQMQLPFVLQSAETMKAAVAFLEPFMDKAESTARGTMVLATVKGDVHDIGKNLVDIILTNNGYRVVNLGIKVPIDTILDAASDQRADAIGMSGLLVKSTAVMKENLALMSGRGIRTPVVLGGAALTRRFVESDLRAIYPDVGYAQDAFDGLRFMEMIVAGQPIAPVEPADAVVEEPPPGTRRRADARGTIRVRPATEVEDIEAMSALLGTTRATALEKDRGAMLVVDLSDGVVGGGRVMPLGSERWLIHDLVMVEEQWIGGAAIALVRALRRAARDADANADVLLLLEDPRPERVRLLRALGFDPAGTDDDHQAIVAPYVITSASTAAFVSKSAAAIGEDSAAALRQVETSPDGDIEEFETQLNVRMLRVRSDVARDVPVPQPPFFGSRVVENIRLEKVFEYVNEVALIRGQWQVRKGKRTAEEYRRELEETVYPKYEEMKLRAKRERLLEPRVVYGYFPCRADHNMLVVYRPKGIGETELANEWHSVVLSEGHLEEWLRFEFPRQPHGRHLCMADYFRPIDEPIFDTVAFQIVTMGSRATEYAHELFNTNNYSDYLYFHGLSVESAEALAEYWHRSVRAEMGIGEKDAADIRRLFSQGYQGSRYSFGYAACPNLEDQAKLFEMLRPERIGVALSDEYMLEPEQSTSAIVVHHPEARYFNIHE